MKKSQLKNIIRESIKELINEQANQQPGYYNVDTCHCSHYDESTNSCSQPLNNYNYILLKDGATSGFQEPNPNGVMEYQYEPNPQVGGMICKGVPQFPNVAGACPFTQQFRIVNITAGWNSNNGAIRNYRPEGCPSATTPDPVDPDPVDESFTCYGCVNGNISPLSYDLSFAQNVEYLNFPDENGVCGTIPEVNAATEEGIEVFYNITYYLDENHPQLENCGAEGSFGTTGNYEVFDYPPEFNPSDWTANFIDMIINHPNPCNFLTQRITQFNTQLTTGNVGPLQANQLMQKIAVCQELFQMVGCGGMNEQISGIKRYRLDPKAAAVIKRMAPKLRGLASRGRGGNRLKELAGIK